MQTDATLLDVTCCVRLHTLLHVSCCWELLHPFAHHFQHGRNKSQHCWTNNVGSCVACSAGVLWVGETLFVFVILLHVVAIFDFMTVEDWGEYK